MGKYKNIEKSEFIICISVPDSLDSISPTGPIINDGIFTKNKKYKILEYLNGFQINVVDDKGNVVKFNLFSSYGEHFCTLSYLRSEKLKKLKCT